MGRPRQVSDEKILEVMRETVRQHGPNVALDVVARELEITTPALLKRFGNKQALMLAALRPPPPSEWMSFLDEGPSDAPLEVQLRDVFTRISEFLGEWVPCIIALRESGIPKDVLFDKKGPNAPHFAIEAIQRWLERAQKRGLVSAPELSAAAYAMFGAIQTRCVLTHTLELKFSGPAQRRYTEEIARIFTRALAPSTEP